MINLDLGCSGELVEPRVIAEAKGVWDGTEGSSSMNLVGDPKSREEIDGMGIESLYKWIKSKGYAVS